ncbi:hypothetical protein BBK36DRAFT_169140, partial [Trichoderma citrinoviride]
KPSMEPGPGLQSSQWFSGSRAPAGGPQRSLFFTFGGLFLLFLWASLRTAKCVGWDGYRGE